MFVVEERSAKEVLEEHSHDCPVSQALRPLVASRSAAKVLQVSWQDFADNWDRAFPSRKSPMVN